MKNCLNIIALSLVCLSTSSCGVYTPVRQDGPPSAKKDFDVNMIPDPIPTRVEPSKFGNPDHYTVLGQTYYPLKTPDGYRATGTASWYGSKFNGQWTSTHEPYDMMAMTAAHRTLPIPCYAKVTNLNNHKTVIVRVNDRGPFRPNRIIDLSYAAAKKLDIFALGTAPVMVETVQGDDIPSNSMLEKGEYLQIGVFGQVKDAKALIKKLPDAWASLANIKTVQAQKKSLQAVWIGPFYYHSSLTAVQKALMQKHYPSVVKKI